MRYTVISLDDNYIMDAPDDAVAMVISSLLGPSCIVHRADGTFTTPAAALETGELDSMCQERYALSFGQVRDVIMHDAHRELLDSLRSLRFATIDEKSAQPPSRRTLRTKARELADQLETDVLVASTG